MPVCLVRREGSSLVGPTGLGIWEVMWGMMFSPSQITNNPVSLWWTLWSFLRYQMMWKFNFPLWDLQRLQMYLIGRVTETHWMGWGFLCCCFYFLVADWSLFWIGICHTREYFPLCSGSLRDYFRVRVARLLEERFVVSTFYGVWYYVLF